MTIPEMLEVLRDEHGAVKRAVCLYGESGAGKTEAILELIRCVCLPQGLKARVYVGDGSAANYVNSGLVTRGIVELCDYSVYDWPLSTVIQIAQGYWPEGGVPGAPLVPTPKEERAKIGCWVFEGLSVMGDYIMGNRKGGLAEQSGRGIKIGQDSPIQIQDAEVSGWRTDKNGNMSPIYKAGTGTGMTHGGNPISHYNVGQLKLITAVEHSKTLPGWVIWSAHERMAVEKLGGNEKDATLTLGEKVIGPELVGSAKTATISRMFNETLHCTVAKKTLAASPDVMTGKNVKQDEFEHRIYTRDHYDPDGVVQVKYRSVTRAPRPELVKLYYTGTRPGEAIRRLYLDIAKGNAAQLADLDKELALYAPAGKEGA